MKKFIMIIVALLAMIAFDAKAQTTYSCLEVVDGETTGYAIDITITENNGAVTFSRNRRTATPSDKVVIYNLTNVIPTLQGNQYVFDFIGSNYYYLPFDMISSARQVSNTVGSQCLCFGSPDDCYNPVIDGANLTCDLANCPIGCKITIVTQGYVAQGIFITASSVSEL